MTLEELLQQIPVQAPFRFVDALSAAGPDHAAGSYRFREDAAFYAGHFPGHPVTPGVVLTECMGQIGAMPIALLQMAAAGLDDHLPVLAHADVELFLPVFPGDHVTVRGALIYFRKGVLKCKVDMHRDGDLVAAGTVSCKLLPATALKR